ncbi:MAG: SBBP repeat-containing protein, partial [Terriglobia bacterium]
MDSRQVSHRRSGSAVLAAALALAIFGPRAMARNSPVLVSKPLTNPSILAAAISASPSTRDPNTQARMRQREDKLPLSFEANRGQTNHRVKFLARGAGYMLFLTGNEAVLSLRQTKRGREEAERRDDIQKLKIGTRPSSLVAGHSPDTTEAIVRLRLAGANRRPQITGVGELPGKTNYFIGNDPAKWRTNVPTYAKV